ncbi:MAG: PilZ domain-containing protein [Treponema sp.]|jgi:hypothetical protein|nr:PilZ domain-containing protein [Treponema sp.]
MKLLLVLDSEATYQTLSRLFPPPGFELIRYRHVLKAMDNLDEADPAGIIISARDFPRHWKAFVRFARYGRPEKACPIAVLRGEAFPPEEAGKAEALGIDGVFPELPEEGGEEGGGIETIRALFKPPAGEGENWSRLGFVFSRPGDGKIITGKVKTLSSRGLSFEGDRPETVEPLREGTELKNCSLRVGNAILSPSCVSRASPPGGGGLALEFCSFPGNERETLETYLENLSPL